MPFTFKRLEAWNSPTVFLVSGSIPGTGPGTKTPTCVREAGAG